MNLNKLFNPESVAVIGASEEEGKVGNVIAKNIATLGYSGKVFFVNPKHTEIFGKKCYPELKDIQEKVDLAVIVIPAKFVNRVIRESAKLVKNFVVISAGFSETSTEGREREEELKKIAEQNELNILGPNCLGFIIPDLNLNASFAGGMPGTGNISFVTQSGALAVALMDIAKVEEMKFSSLISIGNKMSIDEADVLEHLGQDEKTKVIGMYLEGIKNSRKFAKIAREVSMRKPIVVLKAGKSEKAQKAISSHTGALAGSDAIVSAIFEKAGILRAVDFEEFFSLLNLISRSDAPKNKKVAVITNAGGPGVLTADAFEGKQVELAVLSEETKEELKSFLPEESSVENPIDLLGDAMDERYRKALETIDKENEIGTAAVLLTPQDQTPVDKIADEIIKFKGNSKKSVVTIFIGGERIKRAVLKLEHSGIPNFSFPDQCLNALNKYYLWNQLEKLQPEGEAVIDEKRQARAEAIIKKAKSEGRSALFLAEAGELMELYGIKTVETADAEKAIENEIKIKYPAVLKIDSDKVLHKTEKKGVVLNIKNQKELKAALKKMRKNFPEGNLIVQPMLPRQTELIAGLKIDPVSGPVVVYGLGGIYTEIFKMVNFLIPPVSPEEVERSLLNGKSSFLFRETRGQKPYDLKEISKIIFGISELSMEAGEIKEIDINPLLVYNDGNESLAVDVKIVI